MTKLLALVILLLHLTNSTSTHLLTPFPHHRHSFPPSFLPHSLFLHPPSEPELISFPAEQSSAVCE